MGIDLIPVLSSIGAPNTNQMVSLYIPVNLFNIVPIEPVVGLRDIGGKYPGTYKMGLGLFYAKKKNKFARMFIGARYCYIKTYKQSGISSIIDIGGGVS